VVRCGFKNGGTKKMCVQTYDNHYRFNSERIRGALYDHFTSTKKDHFDNEIRYSYELRKL
jgi:hypothetical protein